MMHESETDRKYNFRKMLNGPMKPKHVKKTTSAVEILDRRFKKDSELMRLYQEEKARFHKPKDILQEIDEFSTDGYEIKFGTIDGKYTWWAYRDDGSAVCYTQSLPALLKKVRKEIERRRK